jgi:probable addiction module antidote protein
MGEIAKSAGLNRESLYKVLGETGNPEFATVMRIVRALGLTLSARPASTARASKRRRVA